jgi:hypothetical protein
MATKTKAAPAAKKTHVSVEAVEKIAKKVAPKAAPKKRAPRKPKEPAAVETALVELGDAHAVLTLDKTQFRIEPEMAHQLYHDFERANLALN